MLKKIMAMICVIAIPVVWVGIGNFIMQLIWMIAMLNHKLKNHQISGKNQKFIRNNDDNIIIVQIFPRKRLHSLEFQNICRINSFLSCIFMNLNTKFVFWTHNSGRIDRQLFGIRVNSISNNAAIHCYSHVYCRCMSNKCEIVDFLRIKWWWKYLHSPITNATFTFHSSDLEFEDFTRCK